MKLQDLIVGSIYFEGDAVYKVIYLDSDSGFAVVIHYSLNHKLYNVETWKSDELSLEYIEIETDNESYYNSLFDNIDISKLY